MSNKGSGVITRRVLFVSIVMVLDALTTSSQPPWTDTVLLGPMENAPVVIVQAVLLSSHCSNSSVYSIHII